ncbi:hypothetical protein ABVT39_018615 [Epinephelus coioides]
MEFQENGIKTEHCHGLAPVPVTKKVLMFLWYMANHNSFREMSDKFFVSQSTAHKTILEVLNIMCTIGPTFISWSNVCKKAASAAAFHWLSGLSGVIGAIDGCHIGVQRPPIRGGDYMNRKSFYSILLQAIVDERGREKMGKYCLLGDSAYIGQAFPFIITPKHDTGALAAADHLQNARISHGRVVVEQAFGRMTCKWRRL